MLTTDIPDEVMGNILSDVLGGLETPKADPLVGSNPYCDELITLMTKGEFEIDPAMEGFLSNFINSIKHTVKGFAQLLKNTKSAITSIRKQNERQKQIEFHYTTVLNLIADTDGRHSQFTIKAPPIDFIINHAEKMAAFCDILDSVDVTDYKTENVMIKDFIRRLYALRPNRSVLINRKLEFDIQFPTHRTQPGDKSYWTNAAKIDKLRIAILALDDINTTLYRRIGSIDNVIKEYKAKVTAAQGNQELIKEIGATLKKLQLLYVIICNCVVSNLTHIDIAHGLVTEVLVKMDECR